MGNWLKEMFVLYSNDSQPGGIQISHKRGRVTGPSTKGRIQLPLKKKTNSLLFWGQGVDQLQPCAPSSPGTLGLQGQGSWTLHWLRPHTHPAHRAVTHSLMAEYKHPP